jgi:hypothetical protein
VQPARMAVKRSAASGAAWPWNPRMRVVEGARGLKNLAEGFLTQAKGAARRHRLLANVD